MSSSSFRKWRTESRGHQEKLSKRLGDRLWDNFDWPADRVLLENKIGISLFGKTLNKNFELDLTNEERILVTMIRQKCVKYSGFYKEVRVAVIFIFVHVDDQTHTVVPLIRVMVDRHRYVGENKFIDHLGRVYNGWDDYKKNNTWKMCWMCVPCQGYYSANNDIEFWDQFSRDNAEHIIGNVIKGIGKACALTGVALTYFPPTTAFGLVVTGIGAVATLHSITLDIVSLIDRVEHDQPIDLTDEEARNLWMNILGNVCGLGGLALGLWLQTSVLAGNTVSTFTLILFDGLKFTATANKANKIINSFGKLREKKNITETDYFNFITDLFLFYHCIITYKSASTIVRNLQADYFNNRTPGTTPANDNVRTRVDLISELNRIDHLEDLNNMGSSDS